MQALPATASAVRRKPYGRREPAKRGPDARGASPPGPPKRKEKAKFHLKNHNQTIFETKSGSFRFDPHPPQRAGHLLAAGFPVYEKHAPPFRRGGACPARAALPLPGPSRFCAGHPPTRRGRRSRRPANIAPPPLFRIRPRTFSYLLSTLHSPLFTLKKECRLAAARLIPAPYRAPPAPSL